MIGYSKLQQVGKTEAKKPKAIKKLGDKGLEWEAAKDELGPAFLAAGIDYCEVTRYLLKQPEYADIAKSFRPNFFHQWAHGKKRKELQDNELLTLVVKCCHDAHDFIEYKVGKEEMLRIVTAVIKEREVQPRTAL